MTENTKILPAAKADIPRLAQLINSAYRGEESKEGWTTEADLLDGMRTDEEDLERLLKKGTNSILICVDETNALLGCVYLQNKGSVMYLGMLTVWPKMQAKGIGKQLVAGAEAYASQKGCKSVEMTVISIRSELIAWYNKRGYHSTGATQPFPPDSKFGIAKRPLEFIVMAKIL